MANLATAFKEEITRLARKEVKAQTEVTKRASSRHRREIAELKRQVSGLQKKVSSLEGSEKKRVASQPTEPAPKGVRFQSRGLKTHREKIGLSAENYGRLVGVSKFSIYDWESGKTKPRADKLAALADVRRLGKREAMRRLDALR